MVNFWRSLRFTMIFAVLLGLVYPLVVTGIGQVLFPFQANGSMVTLHGHSVGSLLIAQNVTSPGLFHPRPSAVDYTANNSGGSNLGPTNPALITEVKRNLQAIEQQNPGTTAASIPPDMVESSGSGLDPDISLQDALIQVPRIAKASGLSEVSLKKFIAQNQQGPALGIWGQPVVNVNQLNLTIEKRIHR